MSIAPGGDPKNPSRRKKNSLDERIERHLTDKNDHITDEDIRNVRVGDDSVEGTEELDEAARKKRQELPKDDKIDPLDVLSAD